ncbi:ribosome maturation factor RimM [Collinsella vaginalis]|uniref:ribosome maturation factor RimM n=1 Tax=Collinsella vaginalis TaxID=1870987 RepID=UPI000A270B93|nr:ribosome maturation factor RimM [Collinsella vaginalis]
MSRLYRNIARVIKPHGSKGEVVVAALRGLPFCVSPGLTVALTPPALDRDRFCTVEGVSGERDGTALVRFSGITSIQDAEGITGCRVLARRSDLSLADGVLAFDELIGREVVDGVAGPLGRIDAIMESPAQDIWVVAGARGEIMIPAASELVGTVPPDGPIHVHLPAGLIEGGD